MENTLPLVSSQKQQTTIIDTDEKILKYLKSVHTILEGVEISGNRDPYKCEDRMIYSEEIVTILNNLLQDRAHIIHPGIGSTYNCFSGNEEARQEAAYQLALEIDTIVRVWRKENRAGKVFDIKLHKPLTKPIIAILNTVGKFNSLVEANQVIKIHSDDNTGSHWLSVVILPPTYIPPCQSTVSNPSNSQTKARIYPFDSLPSMRKLPQQMLNIFIQGSVRRMAEDEVVINEYPQENRRVFPCLQNQEIEILENTSGKQQGQDLSCGFWAIANALMTILTGTDEFWKQTAFINCVSEQKSIAGLYLRRILSSLKLNSSSKAPSKTPKLGSPIPEKQDPLHVIYNSCLF